MASMPAAWVRRHCAAKSPLKLGSSEWYPGGAKRSQKSPADQWPTLILISILRRNAMASARPRYRVCERANASWSEVNRVVIVGGGGGVTRDWMAGRPGARDTRRPPDSLTRDLEGRKAA